MLQRRAGWVPGLVVSLLWAILPALPALWSGSIPGHGFTDLVPSVWGLDVFCEALPGFAGHTERFGAPDGIGFYYSSPIHGLVGWPVWAVAGPAAAYTATLLLARAATVFCMIGWLRALGRSEVAAIAGGLLFGASPFFHGYAVEGIAEGTDGWTLALWAWMVSTHRRVPAILAFALCVLSSWYLGMVVCLLALAWGFRERRAWLSAVGLLAAAPALAAFFTAFGGNAPLDEAVRIAMGAPLRIPTPGLTPGLQPFALNTYVGFSTVALAALGARRSPWLAAGAMACFVLSTGRGPWWELPVLELVRFPYRWHAGTLLCLAALVSQVEVRWRWLLFLPFCEGLLLSPVEPILPSTKIEAPGLYQRVRSTRLLELPGPLAMPPGVPNPSRSRASYLLGAQLSHRADSPWTLDFNGISRAQDAPWLESFRSWDPLLDVEPLPLRVAEASAAGVTQAMVHRDQYRDRGQALEAELLAHGATLVESAGGLVLYRFPEPLGER